jgi:hypothetical protein
MIRSTSARRDLALALWALLLGRSVLAQGPGEARLLLTAVDTTGGVLPGAKVTVTGLEEATRSAAAQPATTSAQGVATLSGLRPGRYDIQVEFPGFETAIARDIRLRTGDNKRLTTLALQKLQDTVTVGRDRQEAAADRQNSFGSALTREQIEALSDDPDILRQQLIDMAGPGAIIRVDSFEGAPLPPKAQIKSIHITRDGFAAENHNAGAFFIDIVTQPGVGPVRGQTFYRLRDGDLTGRSPFTAVKGPEQLQNYYLNLGGTLAKEKSSFALFAQGTTSYTTPNLNVALPTGTISQALNLKTPRDNVIVQGLFDYALTKDQTFRASFYQTNNSASNLGVGVTNTFGTAATGTVSGPAFDLPERAYRTSDSTTNLRLQEAGPLGRRFFTNTRASLTWSRNQQHADLEAPTTQVLDAFTAGGAQMAGERHSTAFTIASDLDYVRGRHSLRAGVLVDGGDWHSTLNSNYLGTYTFNSLAAYEAGQPSNYTRRVGDPSVGYAMVDAGVYLQDDIRFGRNLTLSPGIRYESQAHVHDWTDFGPRMAVTWAPFKSGKTTLRGSAGVFYDWLGQTTYEQALRVDGFHQQEVNIVNPTYPDPGNVTALAANRYFVNPAIQSPRNTRLSAGIDQALYASSSWTVRTNVLYSYTRSNRQWRGLDLNAPVDGARPNSAFANVVEAVDDGSARQHQFTVGWNVGLPPQPPGNDTPTFWAWKRFAVFGSYIVTRAHNDTDGDFSLSPTGTLTDQWGRSTLDLPSRLNFNVISLQLKRTTVQASLNQQSGSPYTETTGFDSNGDGIFNDRPLGVERNTLRGQAQWTLSGYVAYAIPIRRRAVPVTGVTATGFTGSSVSSVGTYSDTVRYRVTFSLQAQNITNHSNYTGYSGVLTSPFFDRPTAVLNPRRIDLGVQFSF